MMASEKHRTPKARTLKIPDLRREVLLRRLHELALDWDLAAKFEGPFEGDRGRKLTINPMASVANELARLVSVAARLAPIERRDVKPRGKLADLSPQLVAALEEARAARALGLKHPLSEIQTPDVVAEVVRHEAERLLTDENLSADKVVETLFATFRMPILDVTGPHKGPIANQRAAARKAVARGKKKLEQGPADAAKFIVRAMFSALGYNGRELFKSEGQRQLRELNSTRLANVSKRKTK